MRFKEYQRKRDAGEPVHEMFGGWFGGGKQQGNSNDPIEQISEMERWLTDQKTQTFMYELKNYGSNLDRISQNFGLQPLGVEDTVGQAIQQMKSRFDDIIQAAHTQSRQQPNQ